MLFGREMSVSVPAIDKLSNLFGPFRIGFTLSVLDKCYHAGVQVTISPGMLRRLLFD
jgi:hypothetical protein